MSTPVDRQHELRDQSTTDLVKLLADETKTLVKQELELALTIDRKSVV